MNIVCFMNTHKLIRRAIYAGLLVFPLLYVNQALSADAIKPEPISVCIKSNSDDNSGPSTPVDLINNFISSSEAAIEWTPSTDNFGVKGYRVYRDNILIGNVARGRFRDDTVSAGQQYSYSVIAYDCHGNDSPSSSALAVGIPTVSDEDRVILEAVPNSLQFRRVMQNSNESQQISLTNWGLQAVSISNVSVSGSGFSVLTSPTTIDSGDTAIIQLQYAPTSSSPRFSEAYVNYEVNGVDANPIKVWGSKITSTPTVVNLNTCQALDQAGATYMLQGNLTSTGTCLSVKADDITLDLNGYTITYGSGGANNVYGIGSAASWSNKLPSGWGGGSTQGLHITNGTVEQAGYSSTCAAGTYGHGIYLFELANSNNILIDNVEVNVCGAAAINIHVVLRKSVTIKDSTLRSKTREIFNRHQLEGMLIKLNGTANDYNQVVNNTLTGGAQGGIYLQGNYNQVYDNTTSQDGLYTNGFGITAGHYGSIFNNTVTPKSGRGIRVERSNNLVHHNVVVARELERNAEYGGCPIGGGYGLQLEDEGNGHATGNLIFNNIITALAGECMGSAIKITSVKPGSGNVIKNNTVFAKRIDNTTKGANGFSFTNVKGGVTFQNNNVTTDGAAIYIDWDGSEGVDLNGDSFAVGDNPASTGNGLYFLHFDNSVAIQDFILRDLVLSEPLTTSLNKHSVVGAGGYVAPHEYFYEQVVQINSAGMDGQDVQFMDGDGVIVATGKLSGGKVKVPVPISRHWNTSSSASLEESILPESMTITGTDINYSISGSLAESLNCTDTECSPTP